MNQLERMKKRMEKRKPLIEKLRLPEPHETFTKTKRGRPKKDLPVVTTAYTPKPVLPPQKYIQSASYNLPETLKLLGGNNLDVGDVFYQERKFVIKKITKYAGNTEVEVEAECLKRTWRDGMNRFYF